MFIYIKYINIHIFMYFNQYIDLRIHTYVCILKWSTLSSSFPVFLYRIQPWSINMWPFLCVWLNTNHCHMLQNTTTNYTTLQYTPYHSATHIKAHNSISVGTSHPWLFLALYCSVLQCVAVCFSVLQVFPAFVLSRCSQVPLTSLSPTTSCVHIYAYIHTHMYTEYARVHIHNTRPAVNVNTLCSYYSVTIYTYMHV